MPNKKTTIHDIARELGITASTVSRALKNNPRISEATRKSVLLTAQKMNYQPNSIAAALRRGTSNLIGVIIPTIDRNFFASVLRGIEEVFHDTSYNVIICQSNDSQEKEKANVKTLLEAQVDGMFVSFAKGTTDFSHFTEVINRGIPLILFDRLQGSIEADAVVIDDFLGAYKATEHLIQQGCRTIVHFAGSESLSIYQDRRRGYESALRDNRLPVDESLIFTSDLKIDSGRQLARKMLSMQTLPDGIFSASDYAAIGAMEELKKAHIQIPEQVAIVGFSNETFTELINPSLSTVDQKSKKMGQFTANMFLERMKNGKTNHTISKTVLTPELIIRKSSLRTHV